MFILNLASRLCPDRLPSPQRRYEVSRGNWELNDFRAVSWIGARHAIYAVIKNVGESQLPQLRHERELPKSTGVTPRRLMVKMQ